MRRTFIPTHLHPETGEPIMLTGWHNHDGTEVEYVTPGGSAWESRWLKAGQELETYVDDIAAGDQVLVTFGRSVGRTPMRVDRWERFTAHVWHVVGEIVESSAVFGPFTGEGSWVDEETGETVDEESRVLSFTVGRATCSSVSLEDALADLARKYDQDAIAFTVGAGRLARR